MDTMKVLLVILPIAFFVLGLVMQLILRKASGIWKSALVALILSPILIKFVVRPEFQAMTLTFSYVLLAAFGSISVWGIMQAIRSTKASK